MVGPPVIVHGDCARGPMRCVVAIAARPLRRPVALHGGLMVDLTPELSEDLVKAICDGFSPGELKMLVRFSLGEGLEMLVSPDRPQGEVVLELIEAVQRRGSLDVLLRGVLRARVPPAAVAVFCLERFPHLSEKPEIGGLITSIRSALNELTSLVDKASQPQVRLLIGRFRADFNTASDQITKIKGYKSLHDCLHNVQLQLQIVADSAARVRQDAGELMKLTRYVRQLTREVQRAKEQPAGLPTSRFETRWIDEFESTVAAMEVSVKAKDSVSLQAGVEGLRGILGQAPRINGLLSAAASDMRLDRLIAALDDISKHLRGTDAGGAAGAPSPTIQRLTDGLRAMQLLRPRLAALVEEHNEWQWLDAQFAAAEAAPGHKPAERVPRWPKVKADFDSFCQVFASEGWSVELVSLSSRWQEVAGGTDVMDSDSAFADFRVTGILRFFDVDTQLMELCGRLTEIATPLDMLLEVVANDRTDG